MQVPLQTRIMLIVNMLNTVEDIAFIRQVETAILTYCKEVHELSYVEHGEDNIIALVNREYAFRFPRNERAARRLVYETALLQKVKGKVDVVPIPELVEVHTKPLYNVAKFISGDHLTAPQVKALSQNEQQAIGDAIGRFMYQFNQAISGLEVRRLRTEANVDALDEPWPVYFQRLFAGTWLPNDKLRPVVAEYYGAWKQQVAQEQNTFAIHDDLHPSNLLFTGPKLSGILDFGDANTGSIESELRWLYIMGDIVLRAAADRYQQLSGATIAYDHIRVWAIMHELSTFTSRLAKQQTDTFPFKRAYENLRNWVPNFPM